MDTLRVWMARRNMTPSQLAAAAGLSSALVHNALGGRQISKDSAEKLCKALDVKLEKVAGLNYK